MRPARRAVAAAWIGAVLCGSAAAQTSASFKLAESVINAGGNPRDGSGLASASFGISHDTIGDAAVGPGQNSTTYRAEAGFLVRYAPAGEVHGLRFDGAMSLAWNHEPSAAAYNLYRATLVSLPGSYGSCHQSALADPFFTEAAAPPQGSGWYYLVTAKNRLAQEGTKGAGSDGTERPNPAPCP